MKRIDLDPNEFEIEKLLREDTVGRNVDVERFLRLLQSIEGAYSYFSTHPGAKERRFS